LKSVPGRSIKGTQSNWSDSISLNLTLARTATASYTKTQPKRTSRSALGPFTRSEHYTETVSPYYVADRTPTRYSKLYKDAAEADVEKRAGPVYKG
jgi:hypothetical protein